MSMHHSSCGADKVTRRRSPRNRDEALDNFKTIREDYQEMAQLQLVHAIKKNVKWMNEGSVPHSMRTLIKKVDDVIKGVDLDSYLNKKICFQVLKALPKAFIKDSPKDMQS